jgi:hypothetical protein
MVTLSKDFREFLELLSAHEVRYLVIGGFAVAFHGYPRFTGDFDIWIDRTLENAERMRKVFDEFGFSSLNIRLEDLTSPNRILQLGYPPVRIDILTSADGVDFDVCFEERITSIIDDVAIHFIDLDNLRKNKRAVGRIQDLADLENLHDVPGSTDF